MAYKADLPRYIQIADSLLDQIESGELAPGTRLPPERKLSELFEVNRLTLRRALGRLETLGLIIRQHGKGNFVAEPKIERQTGGLVGFSRGMERRGYAPGAQVITFEQRPVEAAIARRMEMPVLTPVYYGHRLRLINQEPVMLEEFWMPVHVFPDLERHDLTNHSTYEIMEAEYGVSMIKARRSFEPAIATEYEAELLGIEAGAPLMLVRRLAFDQNERCVEYGKDLYRGDRFRFVTEEAFAPGLQGFQVNQA
ncbi:MAG: GntR family transcriptional regulator [Anaerolineales bacterium]|nr:GntR family transcriptional regulator [Anaerolineales bacterium]